MMTRDDVCICLALYDWAGEIRAKSFVDISQLIFVANGIEPNIISYSDSEGVEKSVVDYSQRDSILRIADHQAKYGLGMYRMIDNWGTLIFDWQVAAYLNTDSRTITTCFSYELKHLGIEIFDPLITHFASLATIPYGIGYKRPFQFGPSIYADGMIAGIARSANMRCERDRISAWFNERIGPNRHLEGMLRDVYPINIISAPHLARHVEGVPLASWIASSPSRGRLNALPNGAWLWKVDEDDIEFVRSSLKKEGLLIAYDPYRG